MSKRRSVLITISTNGGGDRYPVIALACGLRDRGDQVTVLCNVATSKLIASTGLDTLIIPPEYGQDKFLVPWWQELKESGEVSLNLARSLLWGLADHPVRSLLSVADEHLRDELGELPSNATVTEYVPHSHVLKQASVVVSHAGHGSVSKALYFGVPMVLCPWDLDQPGVAARAKALGVANVVQRVDVSPETVQQAVTTVLNNPKYRETATRVSARLKTTDAVDVACRLLERF